MVVFLTDSELRDNLQDESEEPLLWRKKGCQVASKVGVRTARLPTVWRWNSFLFGHCGRAMFLLVVQLGVNMDIDISCQLVRWSFVVVGIELVSTSIITGPTVFRTDVRLQIEYVLKIVATQHLETSSRLREWRKVLQ